MDIFKTLGEYVNEVFDRNKDGVVSFKELLGLFPNSAIAIALLVVDVLVLVGEYRVWDFAMTLTHDPFKALGFVLVAGFPFYLAQVLWLYPRATFWQQIIAGGMAVMSLYTSAFYGFADLSRQYDETAIYKFIVQLGVGYVVALLFYVLFDTGVRAWRMKVKAQQAAKDAHEMNEITRSVLTDLRRSLEEEKTLKRDFDPEAVENQLNRLRGQKGKSLKQATTTQQPLVQSYAEEVGREELKTSENHPRKGQ